MLPYPEKTHTCEQVVGKGLASLSLGEGFGVEEKTGLYRELVVTGTEVGSVLSAEGLAYFYWKDM